MSYQHQVIEKKWQDFWDKNKTFKTYHTTKRPKFYALDMFPYPSGAGLHVGHPEGYTATDIISRYKRMNGYNVMHPMGWDAFGLPAEQYALQTGNDPRDFTAENIQTFKRQIKMLGLSYDWDREINTSNPSYYRWTQWIFIKLYQKGLAELRDIEVNWCEALGTVLANEEIINLDGKMVSERGFHLVTKKPMKQWVLKITEYAERLLDDLVELDWPESIKEMQRHWIGKSEGALITFAIDGTSDTFEVFTTRADTIYGATYCVLAPEHPLVKSLITKEQLAAAVDYIDKAKAKSDLERLELNKEKTGVFTGSYAINPLNKQSIPIWIADYVLASYGTGAVMAVPAHDERDYQFATKYQLPIIKVLEGDITTNAFTEDAIHLNSDMINGLMINEATNKIIDYLSSNGLGQRKINYRLRDWVFSRQRYWGEPFPIIHYEDGTIDVVDLNDLPVELPIMKEIKISGTGESPLANALDWLEVVRNDGVKGRRETNTMPQWAGSCWYYLAYLIKDENGYLPLSDDKTIDLINEWLPVDLYIGGAEHAVLHLLYARFWHKVLYDIGIVKTKEPFLKLFNQGMILGEDGVKMSKSWGNVINPDDIVNQYGADTLRVYEMFMGPLEATKPWSTQGVEGARRFLDRVYRLFSEVIVIDEQNDTLSRIYHQTVKKVTEDYENLRFNTAIAQMMIFVNEGYKNPSMPKDFIIGFLKLLNPLAPHLSEELRQMLFQTTDSMAYLPWPTFDEKAIAQDEITVVVQVNGKLRDKLIVSIKATDEEVQDLAKSLDKIKPYLAGKDIQKIIVIPQKLVNIVVK